MYDLLIRGGSVIDGTGSAARPADVAVSDGRIAAVGPDLTGEAARTLDASGLLVTPGWVDVHTHYDGQVSWDAYLSPSCWHGVTTVVMGNCGVGFAPAHPDRHEWLIGLMEGVEDIPGTALAEGITWEWESFPEYLDAIDRGPRVLDVAAQVPHGAVRAYVMGERGADHRTVPSEEEIAQMGELTKQAILAGALGFTTSRTRNHRTKDGEYTPSLTAGEAELLGIARALGEIEQGVFEIVADFGHVEDEFDIMRRMVEVSGRPMSISLAQSDARPDQWREVLDLIQKAVDAGLPMKGQVPARAIGIMLGLEATLHPFVGHPSYRELVSSSHLERVARLRDDDDLRRRILAEDAPEGARAIFYDFERIYELGSPPNYEPDPAQSIAARARAQGIAPAALAYDLLLENGGRALLYRPFLNYTNNNLDVCRELMIDDNTVPGLGDAGAHCGMICDGSFPTFLLAHWGRDRTRGDKLPIEWLVKQQCADTAALVGLRDRGVLAAGMKADINLIDFDALGLEHPEIVFDLPAGGKRLLQRANGYRATIVSGEVTFENGEPTGAMPGHLVRGAQPGPSDASR
jgi:N-acyl-D-aspartate/D-glutamate deacylase